MTETKYGIKVPLAVDDYIWVTEDTGKCSMFELRPVLYESFDKAKAAAKKWGPMAKVESFVVDALEI